MSSYQMFSMTDGAARLYSPNALPLACGYLYNAKMLLQLNCRGYARSQFMQPEPSKYSFGPMLEAKTFIQPEQGYFTHHPGRFFYVKNRDSGKLFSAPYEPCRVKPEHFEFCHQKSQISWQVEVDNTLLEITVSLASEEVAELWHVAVINTSDQTKSLSLYPYFSIGYQSWMNREADYDESLQAIIAKSITPYQKLEDYYKNQELKDCSYLLSETTPDAWLCNKEAFESNGQLAAPDAIKAKLLNKLAAKYEDPVAVMQFDLVLKPNARKEYRFIFGPAKDRSEIVKLRKSLLSTDDFSQCQAVHELTPKLTVSNDLPMAELINHWLPNQTNYHGKLHRLTTDPQTRNYLQDAIGMCMVNEKHTRNVITKALSQQSINGEMPDGILLDANAELKYINQIPHADANIWLPIVLQAYLNETNDVDLLVEKIAFGDDSIAKPLFHHIELALEFVLNQRDERGLCLIHQGDWCDPMNMVGHKGKGVSSWLTMALSYAIKCWINVIELYGSNVESLEETLPKLNSLKQSLDEAVNAHCWYGDWYARGITDDNKPFGVQSDEEGRIYLNPQSWALLSGAATMAKKFSLLNEVERQLNTPYGVMMLAPSYTKFREDVGRLTQKFPGTAENGSVYNHAAVFYAYALYQVGEYNKAYQVLLNLLPNEQDILVRGQLPNFIPNYYRGAYYQLPSHAGRSSQLINTGTVAWCYRCIVEELYGLKGQGDALLVNPKLPDSLEQLSGVRHFRGAVFNFTIEKADVDKTSLWLDGELLISNKIVNFEADSRYRLAIKIPR